MPQKNQKETTVKFYIAGPMSGYDDHNRAAFIAAEDYLKEIGIPPQNIMNPISHEASLMVQQGLVKDTQEAYRLCMAIDCDFICRHATAIYMLMGWEHSRGATAEHSLATCLGLDIYYQS